MQDQQTNRMNSAVPCTPTFNSPSPENPEQLEQCHGCGQGCALGNGAQAIVFGCVDFWTAPCVYDSTANGFGTVPYSAALGEFAQCAANEAAHMANVLGYAPPLKPRPDTFQCQTQGCTSPHWNQQSGYCHGSLKNAAASGAQRKDMSRLHEVVGQ